MTLASVVLAAGSGTRFGGNKMAALFQGEPLISHAIRAARAAPVGRVIVVCPPALDIGIWEGRPTVEAVRITSNAMSASLKAGIEAARDADGVFVFLGDMPLVPHGLAAELAAHLDDHFAVVPRHESRSGHPVLLSGKAFPSIAKLEGDQGAGRLLKQRTDVAFLDVADSTVLLDIDRGEDIARLESRDDTDE
ncbi:MAG: nucleotidyltransferase family protein [Novosphingobium sp.]|nr:nucleotidyltransferase family protein [Novosphingobium sp.]